MTKTKDIDDNNNYSYYEQLLIDNIGLDDQNIMATLKRNNNPSSSIYFCNDKGHNLLFFALICGYNPNETICSYLKSILEHNHPDFNYMTPKKCEEEMRKFNITPLHFAIGYEYNKVAFQLIKINDINLILQRDEYGKEYEGSEEYEGRKNALELSIILKRDQLLQYMIERLQSEQHNIDEIHDKIKFKKQKDQKYFEEILQKVISKPSNELQEPYWGNKLSKKICIIS